MKVVGVVKSIVGTDAVIAIDEDGNQRAIFPGDTLYDNEKLLELSGVQVNVEPVTVADAQKKSESKSDKEVASLQDALLNGKDISELEETAAGAPAGGGNASGEGVSLGAASFATSGHESSIHADASAISEVAPVSVAGVSNVSGGASEEFTSSLETLTVANELLNPEPSTPTVSETPVAITPATPGEVITPSTPSVETPAVSEQPANPSQPANPGSWEEPIVVDPSDPHYDHNHHFDDEPTTPSTPTPSTPALSSNPVNEDEDSDLRTSYTPSYPNTTAGFDFKPTFEGKAEAFADITLSIAEQGRYNWQVPGLHDPDIPVDVLTTKADANGNWKVESSKDYDHGAHKITADVTHTDGSTYHSSTEMFYMPTDPFIVEPVDHL